MNVYVYLCANFFRIYVIRRLMKCFFKDSSSNNILVNITFLAYFVVNSAVYLCINIPVLNLMTNIIFLFIIAFLYKSSCSKKLMAIFFTYLICMLAETVAAKPILLLDFDMEISLNFIIVISNLILLIITSIIERTVFLKDEYFLNYYQKAILILIPIFTTIVEYYILIQTGESKLAILSTILMIIINMFILYLFDNIVRISEELWENRNLTELNAAYKKQLDIIKSNQEKISVMRHDFKNHIVKLSTFVENQKAKEYLSEITDFVDVTDLYVNTGNNDLDGFLNYKISEIKKCGCDVKYSIKIPHDFSWNSFDLTSILGNLLDNAREASVCSNEKYVELNMLYDRGALKLLIRNSCKENVKTETLSIKTTKSDVLNHGYGLKIVRNIVEKYDGEIKMECKNKIFDVNVVMLSITN